MLEANKPKFDSQIHLSSCAIWALYVIFLNLGFLMWKRIIILLFLVKIK